MKKIDILLNLFSDNPNKEINVENIKKLAGYSTLGAAKACIRRIRDAGVDIETVTRSNKKGFSTYYMYNK